MTPPFVDTNILLRYITQDDPHQAQQAQRLIEQLEVGRTIAATCEAVIVEAVYVLASKALYNTSRSEIKTHLSRLIALKGLRLPNKQVYLRALDLYASHNVDFTDALIVAHMERQGATSVFSFDRDFDRLPGVHRQEP